MKKSPQNISKKFLLLTWLSTIGLFIFGIILFGRVDKMPTSVAIITLIDILIGILVFMLLVIAVMVDSFKKMNWAGRIGWILVIALSGMVVFIQIEKRDNSFLNTLPFWTPAPTLSPEQIKEKIISLVNAERVKNGLKPLKENSLLDKSAELKAGDMLQRAYWSHNSPEGVETWVFFKKIGYPYTEAGENLAKNFYTVDAAFKSWMLSSSHKENILKSVYEETGVGVVYPTANTSLFNIGEPVIVQHFGTQMKSYTDSSVRVYKTNNQVPSRTGEIIKYHDWCNNKNISVYENEIIVKKSSDGNTYGMTKDDWECYENSLKNRSL